MDSAGGGSWASLGESDGGEIENLAREDDSREQAIEN